ncbi:DUF6094 domain-containing protein [Paenibacillus sp. GYB003]|uniref:DUF6094 domain-containing protein n=1 Tax=Paenibacillus sp. GYB003 TaxID=2994392 RepID=UPI002F9623AA
MARIASQSKGGYYPTPIEQLNLLCKAIKFHPQEDADNFLNIIDPCCGEGEALKFFANRLHESNPVTYGVELEEGRCQSARAILDHVIHDGYENLRTESKFSLLWLNPPYDEGFGERLEVTFLRSLTGKNNVLGKDGLLFFCIPQYVLKPAAGIISGRFHDVRVYRFTDEFYPIFKQVVLIGTFGKDPNGKSKEIYKMLRDLGDQGPEAIPTLEEIERDIDLYPSPSGIDIFRANRLSVNELKQDLMSSPLLKDVEEKLSPISNRAKMKNPMLPLKATHTAVAIASGAVGGNMGTHIISGITKQIVTTEARYDEAGKKNGETITKDFRSVVRVFWPAGIHDLE